MFDASVVGLAKALLPLAKVTIKFWYVSKSKVPETLAKVPEKTAGTPALPKTILPVPFGVKVISPLAPSAIVIFPEFVPELVFRI